MKRLALLLLPLLIIPATAPAASAKMMAGMPSGNCTMQENATVSINFNSVESDLGVIQPKFDQKIKDIIVTSKEVGVEKLMLVSKNYNVNSQGNDSEQYNVNGSLNFSVVPPAKAPDLMARLSKKGFRPNLNMNAYNRGGEGCGGNLLESDGVVQGR